MSDLISRQAAIMDAESWVAVDEYEKNLQKKVVEWLKEFPPAELGTDCISRRQAIEALGDEPEVWSGKDEYTQGLNNQWHYDRNAIKALPSAQPERKTGEWSVEFSPAYKGGAYCECSQCNYKFAMGAYFEPDEWKFCPNCGADMRGEQDG